ncbi:hypothetical protein F5Y11DRAFT_352957 [Daldinia sp. FL1419]|nr:hypothetical protein F5Y11DRAFT_352957 [Daldinia sp. FL1419]
MRPRPIKPYPQRCFRLREPTLKRVSEWPFPGHYCRPCDIDEDDCEVVEIRAPKDSERGITKDMLIQQVSEAMYGKATHAEKDDEGGKYKIGWQWVREYHGTYICVDEGL